MLQLNNGALAYHLQTLEKQNYIRSARDGMYKRFYPRGTKIPKNPLMGLSDVQKDILKVLERKPGATQKEISEILGISQQVASYHLNQMMDSGIIRAERQGRALRYSTNGHEFC
jgi:predicted transcriptional regulator